MHRAATTGRGPSPWRAGPVGPPLWPGARIEPLVAVAAVQFALILVWSACLAWLASLAYDSRALACFDGDEPACTAPFPLERFLIQAGAWSAVVALAAIAVLVAWRRPRAAPVALVLPALAALAANRLAEIPLPFAS